MQNQIDYYRKKHSILYFIQCNPMYTLNKYYAGIKIVNFVRASPKYCTPFVNISMNEYKYMHGKYFFRFFYRGNLYGINIKDWYKRATVMLEVNDFSYFSGEILEKIVKIWSRLDPESNSGHIFQQDLDYQRSLIQDLKIDK